MSYRDKHDSGLHNCTSYCVQTVCALNVVTYHTVYIMYDMSLHSMIWIKLNRLRIYIYTYIYYIYPVLKKLYKTVIRPTLIYGSECWALHRAEQQRMHTTEMKTLRWIQGKTRKVRIRNEKFRSDAILCATHEHSPQHSTTLPPTRT